MNNYTFHGNPNGQFSSVLGAVGLDIDTGNIFICSGGTIWVEFFNSGNPSAQWGGLVSSGNLPVYCGGYVPNRFGIGAYGGNPAYQTLAACGYDSTCYISTAQLASSPYTTQELITAKFQGAEDLIAATDDGNTGNIDSGILSDIISNVTTEINGYLSSVYPCPLMQTKTVAVIQIIGVDVTGAVTGLQFLHGGNYCTSPASINSPVYLRYIEPEANECWFGDGWQNCQTGSGLSLSLAYTTVPYADASGNNLNAYTVSGIPTIANSGVGYCLGDILVLVGGTSFVPGKVREAALSMICHDLLQRRLNPSEKNLYALNNEKWRGSTSKSGMLSKIGEGEMELDGTYRTFYSPASVWGQKSVLEGANSL